MPPRTSLTTSFSITDATNEVICPLFNQDGSCCRKRCTGDKKYRSMQEHIRRAHPQHYIPKLPATEESFLLMVNTPPNTHPVTDTNPNSTTTHDFPERQTGYRHNGSGQVTPRYSDEYSSASGNGSHPLGEASAAAALAELYGSDRDADREGGYHSDLDGRRQVETSVELPPMLHISNPDVTSDPYSTRQRETLPSLRSGSPPGLSATLPPLQQTVGPLRPKKQGVSKRPKEGHRKKNSGDLNNEWLRRFQNDDDSGLGDRKAVSLEPEPGKRRWIDLIDAVGQAASANGVSTEDRTPMPQSPVSLHRSSMPPSSQHNLQRSHYQASPLQQALTPPSHNQDHVEPFPSVESGNNFHMSTNGLSNSSPDYSSQNVQIYCAACHGFSFLKSSYACTECICGFCATCVEVLTAEHGARRKCPNCATIGGRFKPFQLQIR